MLQGCSNRLETVYGCELNEISLLHALFYIRSGTNLNVLINITNGAQQDRITGGMQILAERIAEPFLSSIKFNCPVVSVTQEGQTVTVRGDGFIYQSHKVIIAIPPVLLVDIKFEPALPVYKSQLLQKLSLGIVGKVLAVYEKPFWRSDGYSGQVVADEHAMFQTLFDSSPKDGQYGVLLAFCIADRAREFFSRKQESRKKFALDHFIKYFGQKASNPIHYIDHNWAAEPWSKGCYAALYPTGGWTNFRNELVKPFGQVHFAGTETSAEWYGYIEGAVRSGERAANEALNTL